MSGMSLAQALALVGEAEEHLGRVSPGLAQGLVMQTERTREALGEVEDRVRRLVAGGYRLERLQSTQLLCAEAGRKASEIRNLQQENLSRMLSIAMGLNEVKS